MVEMLLSGDLTAAGFHTVQIYLYLYNISVDHYTGNIGNIWIYHICCKFPSESIVMFIIIHCSIYPYSVFVCASQRYRHEPHGTFYLSANKHNLG